jgi:transposase-like protein
MSPAPDERDRIRAAMDRILQGTPQRSNGALTIVALAQEAGVPRNALTQRHLDLKNDFYAQVRARGQTPDSEIRLRQQIVKLKELRTQDATELAQLRTDVEHLVRAVNQLTAHNRQLLHSLSQPNPPIQALPTQPHPGRSN